MILEQLRQFNSEATERSQLFNENPSFRYLKKLEAKTRSVRKNNPKAEKLPFEFFAADTDGDGYVSADELLKAIDSFFEGDSGVEQLNGLIDFFFEQ
jgi:Ca2+-binding EF-hand superfamily protein